MFLKATAWFIGLFFMIVIFIGVLFYVLYEYAIMSETTSWLEIISNIEKFKTAHGRVPDPQKREEVLSVGLKWQDSSCPYYELRGPNNYIIDCYFGLDGPSITYYSETNSWKRK